MNNIIFVLKCHKIPLPRRGGSARGGDGVVKWDSHSFMTSQGENGIIPAQQMVGGKDEKPNSHNSRGTFRGTCSIL